MILSGPEVTQIDPNVTTKSFQLNLPRLKQLQARTDLGTCVRPNSDAIWSHRGKDKTTTTAFWGTFIQLGIRPHKLRTLETNNEQFWALARFSSWILRIRQKLAKLIQHALLLLQGAADRKRPAAMHRLRAIFGFGPL